MTAAEPAPALPHAPPTAFAWRHLPDCRGQLRGWQQAAARGLLCAPLGGADLCWQLDLPSTQAPLNATWIELRDGDLSLPIAVRFDAWADFASPDEIHGPPPLQPLLWACRHHRLLEALRAAGGRQWEAAAPGAAPAPRLALNWRLDGPEGPVAAGQMLLPDEPEAVFGALTAPRVRRPAAPAAQARWLLPLPQVAPQALAVGAICLLPARARGALAVGGQRLPLQLDSLAATASVDAPASWIDYMTDDPSRRGARPDTGPLQLEVAVVLQRQRVRLDTLQALAPGAVLELPRLAEDATVTLEVEGQWLADGRIVRIGDHLGIQITSLRADGP